MDQPSTSESLTKTQLFMLNSEMELIHSCKGKVRIFNFWEKLRRHGL